MRHSLLIFLTVCFIAPLNGVAAEKARSLSLKQAREIALQKHPKITVSELTALAAKQVVKQMHSAFLPTLTGSLGAVGTATANTRVVSGILPMSSVYDRGSAALIISQLITDFGRSRHLEQSAQLKAGAEEKNALATRAQILLQVDGAYVGALQSHALVEVAQQTLKTRQLLRDQIVTLAKNQLKSELDASFAEVNYQEALLLLSKSENDLQSAFATLAALLDDRETTVYEFTATPILSKITDDITGLISTALRDRPDLASLRLERDSAQKFAQAEAGLSNPTLSAQGTAGVLPYHDKAVNQDYAAAGIVLNWPIFTGGLNTARHKEAELRVQALNAALQNEETNVVRDVRIALLNVTNAHERMGISSKLLEQARKTESLADARYNAGSTSMVELGQAQLNLTAAEINEANARYEYLARRSILEYQTGALK